MAEADNSACGATDTPVETENKSGGSPAPQTDTPASPADHTADQPAGQSADQKETNDNDDQSEDSEDSQEAESDAEDSKPEILDADTLEERLGEARKDVLVGRYEEAAQILPSCLASITEELSVKLAEPHYLYGKSLFECARMGAGVLEEGALKEKTEQSKKEGSDDESTESADEATETEVDNFEVAWENLEVSRVICCKALEINNTDVPVAKILMEVLTCLGELQVESGCYDKAAADYAECLQLFHKYPDIATQKVLGATHFSIGVAFSLSGEYQMAAEALNNALGVLTKLLEESESDSDESKSLQELVDEIQPRLAEAVDQAREKIEQLKMQPGNGQPTSSSNVDKHVEIISKPVNDTTEKVNDISHLVRKKRSVEEMTGEPLIETTSPKKAKKES